MDVILSSGKVGHYYNLALTLQEAGYLKKFITTSYFKNLNNNSLINNCLIRISNNRVYSRFNEKLNADKIRPIFYPEMIRRIIEMLTFRSNVLPTKIYNYLFDWASCKYLEESDIFFVAITYGLFSGLKAREMGVNVVLDMISAHPTYYIKTLKEEMNKYHVIGDLKDEYYLEKMVKEFEIADFIIVPSQFVYKTMVTEGIPFSKIRIIPYGVNIDQFKVQAKKDNVFRIIFVGPLKLGKGIQYLLEAYKELNLKNSELLLIGRDSPEVANILKEYFGYFIHIPVVPHKFINDYYSNSSVFVLPSLVEGSALVVYEAMACGIPVIVTENCGSVVRDGKDGFVIPIRDVEALKEKLMFFYENESSRLEMGKSARKQAEAYSWGKYQEELIRTLDEIVKLKETTFHANV